jgi:phosphatidylglycerophosphate synthase
MLVMLVDGWSNGLLFAALFGVPIIFSLDAIDGILARRLNSQSLLGSFIDIAADRLVEFIFLQYFISAGLVPLWFILVFYTRIVLTDACRIRAFKMEKVSAAGILLPRPWHFFVLSKFSRSAYAALKAVLFSVLLLTMYRGEKSLSPLELSIFFSVMVFSILRAVPILVNYFPRSIKLRGVKLIRESHQEAHDIATRTTRVVSWVQLASDVLLLTTLLMMLAWH